MIKDHRAIEELFFSFQNAVNVGTQRRILNEIIRLLSIHTVIEERHLYPLCKEVILENNEGI